MQPEHDTKEQTPEEPRHATDCEKRETEHDQRHPVPSRQHLVERVLHEVRRVLAHDRSVGVHRLTEERPQHVCPPAAVTGRMGVPVLVGVLVVNTMTGRPEDWPALKRQRRADCQEILDRLGHLIRPVRVQTVIPHPDSPADADPVEDDSDHDRLPGRVEEGGHREDVKDHHRDQRSPVDFALVAEIGLAAVQLLPPDPV